MRDHCISNQGGACCFSQAVVVVVHTVLTCGRIVWCVFSDLPPYPAVPAVYRVPAPVYRVLPATGHPPRVAVIGRSQSFRLPPSHHPNFVRGV